MSFYPLRNGTYTIKEVKELLTEWVVGACMWINTSWYLGSLSNTGWELVVGRGSIVGHWVVLLVLGSSVVLLSVTSVSGG